MRTDLLLADIEYLRRECNRLEAEREAAESRIADAEARTDQYRIRAYKAERRSIEELIYDLTYQTIDKAIDYLLAGDMKRGIVTLRHILPAQYKHTFAKPKGNSSPKPRVTSAVASHPRELGA